MKQYIKPVTETPDIDLRDCIQDVGGANTPGNGARDTKGTSEWETEAEISEDDGFGW